VTSVLGFINRIRIMLDLPELGALSLLGTEPDHEFNSVLSAALEVPVGESAHPEWAEQGRWVMRFAGGMTARRVGIVTSLDWLAEPPEVRLPDALVDLAVSQHLDVVVGDGVGYVRGWATRTTTALSPRSTLRCRGTSAKQPDASSARRRSSPEAGPTSQPPGYLFDRVPRARPRESASDLSPIGLPAMSLAESPQSVCTNGSASFARTDWYPAH
jgi:hypothetical protein